MWTDEEVWCVLFCSLDFFGKTWLYFSGKMFGQITLFRNVTVETPSPVFLATEILHNFGKVCKSTEILMQAFHSFLKFEVFIWIKVEFVGLLVLFFPTLLFLPLQIDYFVVTLLITCLFQSSHPQNDLEYVMWLWCFILFTGSVQLIVP